MCMVLWTMATSPVVYPWHSVPLFFNVLASLLGESCATDEDRIWPTQFPRRSSSCLERASNSSPLNHHFSWTVQSWVEDLPLQPGVLHRQPLRTFVEECIDLLTYLRPIGWFKTHTNQWVMHISNTKTPKALSLSRADRTLTVKT